MAGERDRGGDGERSEAFGGGFANVVRLLWYVREGLNAAASNAGNRKRGLEYVDSAGDLSERLCRCETGVMNVQRLVGRSKA